MNQFSAGASERSAGPHIGLLTSETKLKRVLDGQQDKIYCRYARYAREAGASLLFFAASGLDEGAGTVAGYRHSCGPGAACTWEPVKLPIPTVIYDRCFGLAARPEAIQVRETARRLSLQVINNPPKVTKLMTFEALARNPELAQYLPYTARLTPSALGQAMARYPDLYLKPDNLYKGKGVYRLTRQSGSWLLQHRSDSGNETRFLTPGMVSAALAPMFQPNARYLIQEGLDLATYEGNRFDFRSLVQKDGQGRWTVTGLVARVAAPGSVITSPRSGGQVASTEMALTSLFGENAPKIVAEIERASVDMATEAERHFGVCADLGLDLGVTRAGQVKLIEMNGKPLRVSLDRLHDPLISERINRFPIHYAVHLAAQRSGERKQVKAPGNVNPHPRVGVLLGPRAMTLLEGPWASRYRRMMQEGEAAGTIPFLFSAADLNVAGEWVNALVLSEGDWRRTRLPLPDVIYHRAVLPTREARAALAADLQQLALHRGTQLINPVSAFTKLQVHEALSFFPTTARFSPELRMLRDRDDLGAMLERHSSVFAKADTGSHGTEVVRITASSQGWDVTGQIGGKPVSDRFHTVDQVHAFLQLTTRGRLWILQQGISLPQVDGRICDLRVILQKDGEGQWQAPLVLVRQGSAGKVAANMSQGGEPFLPAVFRAQFGEQARIFHGVEESARAAALAAAMALESRFGRLGEIGVDVAVGADGRPWILEANTKPVHPQLPGMETPLERYPFHYGAYLARRAWAGRESGL